MRLHRFHLPTSFAAVLAACLLAGCGPSTPVPDAGEGSCRDGVASGSESDVDCGGDCDACDDGKACSQASDCKSLVCSSGQCQAPSCSDGVKNGTEGDADCGGPCPDPGSDGARCRPAPDCTPNRCSVGGGCGGARRTPGVQDGPRDRLRVGGGRARRARGAGGGPGGP